MLIIVEGADCTGKSTLANALADKLGRDNTKVFSKGPPQVKNPVVEYLWPLAGYVPGNDQHIICDRWHIGEEIYPKIFNRDSVLGSYGFSFINETILHLGALIIYLEPPISQVLKRFQERGDKLIKDIDMLSESYFAFRTFMSDAYNFTYAGNAIRFSNYDITPDFINGVINNAKYYERAFNDISD